MAGRNYERLDIYKFGEHLLLTEDLDPVYVALKDLGLDDGQLRRWLLAYWCFYSAGFASWASSMTGEQYWSAMFTAAKNVDPAPTGGRWPRGHERRHFRGDAALKAVGALRERYGQRPEAMVDYCAEGAPCFHTVMDRVREHVLFGPWIAFKVADMTDRVIGEHVDFTEKAVFMFKDPYKSAILLWRQTCNLPENAKPIDDKAVVHQVAQHVEKHFASYNAPPFYDRPVNLQEVETILCKWKSHMNGHYPLFNDIRDIRDGLMPWADHSDTAASFLKCMPEEVAP
jgi:hypothetical protein